MERFEIEDGILRAYTGREEVVVVPEGVHTIGEGAFKACVSLKRAMLPRGLLRIMPEAFKGCRKLEKIEIPKGVYYMGDYAFHRCHGLRKILLPDTVEELGDCVFLYCDSLREARIPGVKRLGKQVFINDVLLEKLEISGELQESCICDVFTGCGKIREIAYAGGERYRIANAVEVVTGEKETPPLVHAIAVDVLRMMELDGRCLVRFLTNLKHVEIPEGIERLGKSCFFDRRGILSVRFPASLKEIESRAFRNCISLERVSFQSQDVQIQEDAFKNCSSLKFVRIGDGPEYEFTGIQKQSDERIPKLVRQIQKQVLGNFRISGKLLFQYLGSESRVVVPEGIERIAEEAFAGNEAIDRVILPESLREIGAYAFRDCLLLQTVVLPEKMLRIGVGAFMNCVKLIRVRLPGQVAKVEPETFKHCKVLREVTFEGPLREIGEQAFYKCSALRELSLPESVETVGSMAFFGCGGLKEISIPEKTVQVEDLAFAQSGVKRAAIGSDGSRFGREVFGDCKKLRTLVLKEGVGHVPDRLAWGCTALTRVSLPKALRSAGRNAWEETPFLSEWLRKFREGEETGEIFWDGREMEGEISLSPGYRIVAGGAFYGNQKAEEIGLPKQVRWIGKAAFKGCTNLRQVSWPSELSHVEPEVFSGCVRLQAVDKGAQDIWQSVGERAFYRCQKLRRMELSEVKEMGKEAFAGCISLEKYPVSMELWMGERALEDTGYWSVPDHGPLIIGRVAVFGGSCEGTVKLPEGITGIGPYAFAGNRRVQKVIFPESLTRIGEGAFFGCSGLLEAELPEGLFRIEDRAFEKCCALKRIRTGAGEVGEGAFAFCTSLEEAEFPNVKDLAPHLLEGCGLLWRCICGLAETAGERSFCGCQKLECFDHGKLRRIGRYAYEDCDHLTRVELREGACVEAYAFEDCGNLCEICLIGEHIRLLEYAFSGCTALQRVWIQGTGWEFTGYGDLLSERFPEMVRQLFFSALSCFQVKEEKILQSYRGAGRKVKIPYGIRRIEAEVFRDVLMLQEVEIPDSVEEIGARAFHGTAWMEEQRKQSPLVTVRQMLLNGSDCQGEVVVPEGIRFICGWAFAGGLGIEKICFLSDRVRVAEYAFRNCIFLKEMALPDGTKVTFTGLKDRERELPPLARQAVTDRLNCFKTESDGTLVECTGNLSRLLLADGITAIGEGAFEDGNLLTEVIFSESLRVIGKRAFAGCKWLREVSGAFSVERIEAMAFSGCGSLRRIELSEAFQELGIRAFEHCTALREIVLPEGLREIPERAFYRCHSLAEIRIPSTVKRIGKEAFGFCKGLRRVEVPEGVVVEERAFVGCGRV